MSVGIPFVGEGGTEITANTEYSYEHTNSNTTGKETTITFPSQEIVCEPGYITKYVGRVQSATFSGELSGKAEVTGSIKIWVQNMKTFKIEQKEINIADIFKYTNSDVQQGLEYEYHAEENAVYITVNIPYTGLGGHYQTVDVEVTPIGKEHDPKAKRRMPLNIYQEKVNEHTVKDLW
ncbi:hypothetical protein CN488_28905 [Bacillus anthracis]|nr:hypothetical protein CN488_28905 [Bacillus anthracis]